MANNFAIAQIFEQLYGYTPFVLPQNALLQFAPSINDLYKYRVDKLKDNPPFSSFHVNDKTTPNENAQGFKISTSNNAKTATQGGAPYYGASDLIGRPVFNPVTIDTGSEYVELPFVMLTFKSKKNIIETPMIERGGSVKELIGIEDWEIDLQGFIMEMQDGKPTGNNNFPDEEMSKLIALYNINKPVNIISALTSVLLPDNDTVVIKSLDFSDKAKFIGVRPFAMQITSDSILKLTIK